MGTLSDLRAGVPDDNLLDGGPAVDLDARPGVLLVAETEADVLEAAGKTNAVFQVGRRQVFSSFG